MSGISVWHVLGTLSPRPSCIVSSYVTPAKCFRPGTAGARQGSCQTSLSAMCLRLSLQASAACGVVSMSLLQSASAQPQVVTGRAHVKHHCLPCTLEAVSKPHLHAKLNKSVQHNALARCSPHSSRQEPAGLLLGHLCLPQASEISTWAQPLVVSCTAPFRNWLGHICLQWAWDLVAMARLYAASWGAMSCLQAASAQPQLETGRLMTGISVCHVLESLSPRRSCMRHCIKLCHSSEVLPPSHSLQPAGLMSGICVWHVLGTLSRRLSCVRHCIKLCHSSEVLPQSHS